MKFIYLPFKTQWSVLKLYGQSFMFGHALHISPPARSVIFICFDLKKLQNTFLKITIGFVISIHFKSYNKIFFCPNKFAKYLLVLLNYVLMLVCDVCYICCITLNCFGFLTIKMWFQSLQCKKGNINLQLKSGTWN